MECFTLEVDADGIALLTWNMPGRSMNVVDLKVMDELEAFLARLAGDAAIKGAVVASGKKDFSGGADLGMLAGFANATMASPDAEKRRVRDGIGRLGTIYRRLETNGKPVAAVIHGVCLGGAFELTLACHHRIAAPSARLGLPESKVGLLPGAGGTQRLPRLIGAPEALKLMLRGTQVEAAEALKLGMVHRVVPEERTIAAAKEWVAKGEAVQPWDRKDFAFPGGGAFSPKGLPMWAAANALYRKETQDNYDAQRAIMSCVFEGASVKSIDTGLAFEITQFTKLLLGPQARAMIRTLFLSTQALNRGARRPAAEPPSSVRTLGVAGAGFMGSGIAHVAARAGLEVVVLDRDRETAGRARDHAARLIGADIAKRRAAANHLAPVLDRIATTADVADLARCDLVIEAVFEDRAVKAEIWPRIDAALPPHALRASNTSTLPIASLAGYVADPANFIGIHFFSPVEKMPLVEIIRGPATSDAALAKAFDFVRCIGKTPIVVNDARGFFTSRVVTTHIAEGYHMLEEGVPPAMIENAGRMAGMPVGPLALADEIALDLQWRIAQATRRDLGAAYVDGPVDRLLEELVVKRERLGRKNGKGFYDYPSGAKKRLWPGIGEVVRQGAASEFDIAALKERLLLIQALETARCFAENVLTDPREADVGAIMGFGFAPFTGGPLSWIDTLGARAFIETCRRYTEQFGDRYRPPPRLVEMAAAGAAFYPHAG